MITFLPFADFVASAVCLDRARLGKQRVETRQILFALAGFTTAWVNHPAVRMWSGYEKALSNYGHAIVSQWMLRGYNASFQFALYDSPPTPPWLGDERLHLSHRSNLFRKDPVHYAAFACDSLPYFWPS